jgi:hypothetical protein
MERIVITQLRRYRDRSGREYWGGCYGKTGFLRLENTGTDEDGRETADLIVVPRVFPRVQRPRGDVTPPEFDQDDSFIL